MTSKQRITREALLRRAAAAGAAIWVAPVFASAATAATGAKSCVGRRCKPGPKGDKKCLRKGCFPCNPSSHTCVEGCLCNHTGAECDALEQCGGNCGCFFNGSGGNPGNCIDLRSGLCSDFSPCDSTGSCPDSQFCFTSCCGTPLCGDCCSGAGSARVRSRGAVRGARLTMGG
jgi:hypothetical protein